MIILSKMVEVLCILQESPKHRKYNGEIVFNFTLYIVDRESPENGEVVFTPEVDGKGGEYDNFTTDGGSSVYPTGKSKT